MQKRTAYRAEAQEEFYNLKIQFKKKSFKYLAKLKNLVNNLPNKKRQYKLLVGCGQYDLPMEIEIVDEWAEKEHCEKIIFQDAGHCVNMDKPNEFNSCLEDFLEKI